MTTRRLWSLGFLLIIVGLVLIDLPVLKNDPLLSLDDFRSVTPMEQIHSLRDYFAAREKGQVWDVEPVRDLSYFVDLQVKKYFPIPAFHLTNLILWLGFLFLASCIFRTLGWSAAVGLSILFLMAFHPAFINTVAWVSARKHLLAAFFLALATLIVIHRQRKKLPGTIQAAAFTLACYTLAVFSHPVSLFWVVWVFFFWSFHKKDGPTKTTLGIMAIISLVAVVLNFYHYQDTFYLQTAGHPLLSTFSWNHGREILASWGRYFWLLIWPTHLLVFYYQPSDPANWVGLALLLIFGAVTFRQWTRNRDQLLWLLYFAGPLLLLTIPKANLFVSDTYLTVPALGAFTFLGSLLAPRTKNKMIPRVKHKAVVPIITGILLIPMILKAHSQIQRWTSDQNFCQQMSLETHDPQIMTCYGMNLLNEGKIDEALKIADDLGRSAPGYRGYPDLLARATQANPRLSLEEKIKTLENAHLQSAGFSYVLAQLDAENKDFIKARETLLAVTRQPALFAYQMKENLEIVLADLDNDCLRARAPCDQTIQQVRDNFHFRDWNEKVFEERLKADQAQP